MYDRFGLFIGGQWRQPARGERYAVINPATEDVLGEAPQAGQADVEEAIAAARSGFDAWRRTQPWARSGILRRIARLLDERRGEIARQLTLEIGKPLDQANGEIQASIDQFEWFADETRRVYGQIVEARSRDLRHFVHPEPIGVSAAFCPWNFPIALAARKIAPALAAGCSIIVRGAEEAPGSVMMLVQCCHDAGLPPGAVNLLNGRPDSITPHVMASAHVRKISFTGSVPVGKALARAAADTLKRVTLELGGHSPVLVFEDADLDSAVRMAVFSKFRNCGQVCISPTRFYVHESRAEAFARAFADLASKIRVGNGMEAGVEMGPLTTRRRLDAVAGLADDAKSRGARLLTGGARAAQFQRGYFFQPTVFADTPESARVMHEEPFGPIVPIARFRTTEEVVASANALPYGLASYVFTRSLKTAHEVSDALACGIVSVNNFAAATAEVPFGGVKDSGYGRECGSAGIAEYLQTKSVNMTLV